MVDGAAADGVALTIADGRFADVEVGVPAPAGATVLHGLTLPGFANAHSHAFHRALRSHTQAGDGSFWTWRDVMYTVASRLEPDSYHRLARAVFAEMAMAGITCVGEFHYLHHRPDGRPYDDANEMGTAVIAAAADAGIRITLLDTLYLHGGLSPDGYAMIDGAQRRFSDGSADTWAERVEQLRPEPHVRIGAAIHSIRAVDPVSMEAVRAWATAHDAPVHAHVSEQRVENEQCIAHHGRTPTGLLAGAGVLDTRFSAVHGTHLGSGDIARLGDATAGVCFCPTTERDLGDGIGPSTELAAAGVALTLGTDSHAVIDMFEEARGVELDDRLRSEHRGRHATSALLAMMTTNGHASLGWDDAGTIAVGQRADLVTVALDSVRTAGAAAGAELPAAVFAATAADVSHVVVDGMPVVVDGRHVRVDAADELGVTIAEIMER
ncbi:MAG: formimidoylglutamate deiminase [Ilumatobacter sp.]|nr:formimidoylglutamate deiminase [Ilumatobacter sp.]